MSHRAARDAAARFWLTPQGERALDRVTSIPFPQPLTVAQAETAQAAPQLLGLVAAAYDLLAACDPDENRATWLAEADDLLTRLGMPAA